MKHYKAIITGGTLFPDCEILEQDRVTFAATFMEAAMQSAFYYVCQDGIDAARQPYSINFYSDELLFAKINITTWQDFARVYADFELTAVPSDKTIFLRRMCVAD